MSLTFESMIEVFKECGWSYPRWSAFLEPGGRRRGELLGVREQRRTRESTYFPADYLILRYQPSRPANPVDAKYLHFLWKRIS